MQIVRLLALCRQKHRKFTIMVMAEAMRNDLAMKEYYEDEKKDGVIEGIIKLTKYSKYV